MILRRATFNKFRFLLLFNAMGAYYFIRDNEIHYELAKSQDKEFIVIAGLVHGITPCNDVSGRTL